MYWSRCWSVFVWQLSCVVPVFVPEQIYHNFAFKHNTDTQKIVKFWLKVHMGLAEGQYTDAKNLWMAANKKEKKSLKVAQC